MAQAGWFADPYGDPSLQRYFDGTQWTTHTAPAATVATPPIGPTGTDPDPVPPLVDPAPVAPPVAIATEPGSPGQRHGSRKPLLFSAAVLIVVALVTGGLFVARRAASPDPPGAGWRALLAQLPDPTGVAGATTQGVDLVAMRAQVGIDAKDSKFGSKTSELVKLGTPIIPSIWKPQPDMWRDVVDVLPYGADRAIEINAFKEGYVAVLVGTFDVDKVTAGLRRSEGVGPDATVATHEGESYLRESGAELEVVRSGGPSLEQLNRPMRVLVAADHLIVSLTDTWMHRAIDAWAGRGGATDRPEIAQAAVALDEIGAVTMLAVDHAEPSVSNDRSGPGSASEPSSGSVLRASGPPASPIFVGTTVRAGTAGAYIVAHKASSADAARAVDELRAVVDGGRSLVTRQPWKEVFTIDRIDAKDALVVATFGTKLPAAMTQAVAKHENIVDL